MSILNNILAQLSSTDWHNVLPFVALSTAKHGEHVQRPLTTRLVEGIVMGAVGGALGAAASMYVALQVMERDISHVMTQQDEMKLEYRKGIDRLENFHWQERR